MENTKTELESKAGKTGQIIWIEQEQLTKHLDKVVRDTVEETLNALLDAEADRLCQAHRYERTEKRQDTRAGHYKRSLATKAGPVELKVPKLRSLSFETAIIERYRRRESSVEEALIEMYLAGVSVRRVEDITEALWGTRVSPGTVSNLNKKVYDRIEKWINAPITGEYTYVFLDGIEEMLGRRSKKCQRSGSRRCGSGRISSHAGSSGRSERRQGKLDALFTAPKKPWSHRSQAIYQR